MLNWTPQQLYNWIDSTFLNNIARSIKESDLRDGLKTQAQWVHERALAAEAKAEEAKALVAMLQQGIFEGAWNAATNSPALTATPNAARPDGIYYTATVSGPAPFAGLNFAVGDTINVEEGLWKKGTQWVRIPKVNTLASLAKSALTAGNNLFNPDLVEVGFVNLTTYADDNSNASYRRAGRTYSYGNEYYTISGLSATHYGLGIAFYGPAGVIGGEVTPQNVTSYTFLLPEGANSFKFTFKTSAPGDTGNAANIMVNVGVTAQPYAAPMDALTVLGGKEIKATSAKTDPSRDDSPVNVGYFKRNKKASIEYTPLGAQLFDYTKQIAQRYIDVTTHAIMPSAAYKIAGITPVKPSRHYTISGLGTNHYGLGVAFYNAAGTLIGGTVTALNAPVSTFLTDPLTASIQFTTKTGASGDSIVETALMLNEGQTAYPYQPYRAGGLKIESIEFVSDYGTGKEPDSPTSHVSRGYFDIHARQIGTVDKQILVFGDSITVGPNSWVAHAAKLLGTTKISNRSFSGAAYRDRTGLSDESQKISYQITQAYADAVPTPDIIISAAGTNDGISSLGDYATAMGKTTLASLDRANLYEALRWAFWNIRTLWPNAVCYAATPIQRADVETATLQPLDDAIIKMAKRYNFIVIDARNESGIVKDFEVSAGVGRDLWDGLHPHNTAVSSGDMKIANCYAARIISTYVP